MVSISDSHAEHEKMLKKIRLLQESQLRNLVMNIFGKKGIVLDYTHGPSEHGADIVLELQQSEDPLRRGLYFLFQIKKGDIDVNTWRNILSGQLSELYCRPIMQTNSNETLARRIVLITSGDLSPLVTNEIYHWNLKLPIPIEVFNGRRLTEFLLQEGYNAQSLKDITKSSGLKLAGKRNNAKRPKLVKRRTN